MSEKLQLIEAFKSLDFELLEKLLDDNRAYMDVPKALFLSRLKQEIEERGVKSYEQVINGVCDNCNKGCVAYKFKAENLPSLNLFLEEQDGIVTDIYLCNALKVDNPDKDESEIRFYFYEEEKVDFNPSLEYLMDVQKVDQAIADFNKLAAKGLVTVEELVHWQNKLKPLAEKLYLGLPFIDAGYKAFVHIDSIYSEVSSLVNNYNKNPRAKEALTELKRIKDNDLKSLFKWLNKYEDDYVYSLKKTDNWEKTGFLILETEPNILVDCSECLDVYLFESEYEKVDKKYHFRYFFIKNYLNETDGRVCSTYLVREENLTDKPVDFLYRCVADLFCKAFCKLNSKQSLNPDLDYLFLLETDPSHRKNAKYKYFANNDDDYQEALSIFKEILEIEPNHILTIEILSICKLRLGLCSEAIQDLSNVIRIDPKYSYAYNNRGNAKYQLKDYSGAIEDYSKAIEIYPKFTTAYNNRGNSKCFLKDYKGAIEDFSKIIEIDPENSFAYCRRGDAKNYLKDYKEAIEDFSKAIEIDPKYAKAYNNRGLVKVFLKDYSGAIEDYSKAIEIDPELFKTYRFRGIAKELIGDIEGAKQDKCIYNKLKNI